MKKLISMITAVCLLMTSLFVSVVQAGELQETQYVSPAWLSMVDTENGAECYVTDSQNHTIGGKAALHVKTTASTQHMYYYQTGFTTTVQGQRYRISGYFKGTVGVTLGFSWNGRANISNVEEAGGGWYHFYGDGTVTEDGWESIFSLQLIANTVSDFYFDDLVLQWLDANGNVTSTGNELRDGDFESAFIPETNTDNGYNEYEGWNPWYFPEGGFIKLSEKDNHTADGSKALYIENGGGDAYVSNRVVYKSSGQNYRISGYYKGTGINAGDSIGFGWGNRVSLTANNADAGNGWTRFEGTGQLPENYFLFVWLNGAKKLYIDDLKVEMQNGGEWVTILTNSFETALKVNDDINDYTLPIPGWTKYYDSVVFKPVTYGNNTPGGEKCLYIETSNAASGVVGGVIYRGINDSAVEFEANTDYTFSFYIRGIFVPQNVIAFVGTNAMRLGDLTPTIENGWAKYVWTFRFSETSNVMPYIVFDGSSIVNKLYLDDMQITNANGEALLQNADFEDCRVINTRDLTYVMAYPASEGGKAVISWMNPTNNNLNIEVSVDGTAQDTTLVNTAADAFNEYVISNLENGYTYSVVLTIKNGEEILDTKTMSVTPSAGNNKKPEGRYYLGGWQLSAQDYNGHYSNTKVAVDNTFAAEGNSSVKLTTNMYGQQANVFANLNQNVRVNTNKDYRLTFKAKKANSVRLIFIRGGATAGGDNLEKMIGEYDGNDFVTISAADANGWKTYSVIFTDWDDGIGGYTLPESIADATFGVIVDSGLTDIWFDDMKLVEYDLGSEAAVSGNLFSYGGFEFGDWYASPISITANGSTVTASAEVESYHGNKKAQLIIARYNGTALDGIVGSITATAEEGNSVATLELSTDLPGAGYSLKAMLWDADTGDYSAIPMIGFKQYQ